MEERDPAFVAKAVAIIELELHPPADGPTFCVDEKTGIGVRTPAAPGQPVAPTRPARREFEYRRHGTAAVLAAFCVNTGELTSGCNVRRYGRLEGGMGHERRSGMDLAPRERNLLESYVAPFTELAGDRRTGRLLGEVIGGIVASEHLVCSQIAAFSPCVGRGPA